MSITCASTNGGNAQRVQYAFGGHSADTLTGQGFADHLYGRAGADTLNGQGRNDTNQFDAGCGDYAKDATSWAPHGTLNNGVPEANFNDVIYGTARNETLNGLGGNDALDGGLNHDVNENTPHLIAIYADCSWAAAEFDGKTRHCKAQKQTFQCCRRRSSAEPSYALSMQLAGHKGLGRRIGSAQAQGHQGAA